MRHLTGAILGGFSFLLVCAAGATPQTHESVLSHRFPASESGRRINWEPGLDVEHFVQKLRSMRVPIVWEAVTGTSRTPTQFIDVTDMDLRSALNTISSVEPRYSWREFDGVIVVRPAQAWTDSRNPLNQHVESIAWSDVGPDAVAQRAVNMAFGKPIDEQFTGRRSPRVTIAVRSGSVLDILVEAARGYPRVAWTARYQRHKQGPDRLFSIGYLDGSMHVIGEIAGVTHGDALPPTMSGS